MTPFSPSYDNKIPKKYSSSTLKNKVENKTVLQKKLHLLKDERALMVCVPTGASAQTNGQALLELLPAMLALRIQVLILGKGERNFAELISVLAEKNPDYIAVIPNEDTDIRTMFAAADASLFLHNATGHEELLQALAYGAVPICEEAKEVQNYNAVEETGNAFIYEGKSIWQQFAAIVRAKETHQFSYDYRTIQKHCMSEE